MVFSLAALQLTKILLLVFIREQQVKIPPLVLMSKIKIPLTYFQFKWFLISLIITKSGNIACCSVTHENTATGVRSKATSENTPFGVNE